MADHTDLGSGKAADAVEDGRQLRARLLGQLVAVEQEVEQEAARRHRTRRQGVAPGRLDLRAIDRLRRARRCARAADRSEEHTSELQSLMRISYAVFCLKNKTNTQL